MASYVLCFVTIDDMQKALEIARVLINKKLAACANILPNIRSVYSWKGQICDEQEHLILIKTTRDNYPALEARIKEIHGYEIPEIISVNIAEGLPEYLRWIDECTTAD